MKKYAWIGSGLAARLTLFTLSAREDCELQHKVCEEDWDCRSNFGIGYTCNSDGFCEEPTAEIRREYCSNTSVNYPPEIFSSTSARRSVTLGTIVDVSGQQLASAARIAMELSNIRGGIGGVTSLGSFNFSVVSCMLSDSDAANERTVRQVARFLRDEVRAEAILLGMNSTATRQAVQEIRDRDSAASENGHTLIVSVNDSTLELENRLKDQDQLWTMAASETSMLKHAGEQLVLRRLHSAAMQLCATGTCKYEVEGEEGSTEVDIKDLKELLEQAYLVYVDANEENKNLLGSYRAESFVAQDSTTGQSADAARRQAFADGVDRALAYVRGDATPGDAYERSFDTHVLACGASCSPKQLQVEVLKQMGCEGTTLSGTGVVNIDTSVCDENYQTDLSAILLLSDSATLSQSFYRALLGANGTEADDVAATIAKIGGVKVSGVTPPQDNYTAETVYMMPSAASSGSMGVFTYDFSSDTYKNSQDLRRRWFQYIHEGRIFGVRQAEARETDAYDEFRAAQRILVRESVGATQHYITQAYDGVLLSMAAIAASVVSMPQDVSFSAADQMKMLRERGAQKHTASLRKHFTGATTEELEALNIPRASSMNFLARSFLPSEWERIVDTRRGTDSQNEGFAYPLLQNTYELSGASGKLRFDVVTDNSSDDIPRRRGAYNYGVWMLATQDKKVDEPKANVDLNKKGCLLGMAPPIGKTADELPDPTSEEYEIHKFVCAVETANCAYDNRDESDDICVPVHFNGRALGYTFPSFDKDDDNEG